MEPDNYPCRSHWLNQIYQESLSSFWVRGSIIRDNSEETGLYEYAHHINGNAFYAIGDPDFVEFIEWIENRFWQDPDEYLGGYDVAIYLLRHNRKAYSWKNFTETVHLFQYTPTIQNVYRTPVNATELCGKFKETYLVHGRQVYF